MQRPRLNVENSIPSVGRGPSSLLNNKRHRVGFVSEAELSVGILEVGGIEEYSTRDQVTMEIGDQGTDVAALLSRHPVGEIAVKGPHRPLGAAIPPRIVAFVDAIVEPALWSS